MIFKNAQILIDSLPKTLPNLELDELLHELALLKEHWGPNGDYLKKALQKNITHSESIHDLFSPSIWSQRLDIELGNKNALDKFSTVTGYQGEIHFAPLGKVLHITASNVVLGMIDSFLMGALTKNINIIKLSDQTVEAGELINESLEKYAPKINQLCYFMNYKGGDEEIENTLFEEVNAIIAWGGEEMIHSVSKRVPPHVKFIPHGPKISFHIISRKGLETLRFSDLVKDITTFDQQACANSQNIYLESGIDKEQFLKELLKSWNYIRDVDANETVEILKEQQLDLYREFKQGEMPGYFRDNVSVSFSQNLFPEPTALNGHIRIKEYSQITDLLESLTPFRQYLQTCGLHTGDSERNDYRLELSKSGINRFTTVGQMLTPVAGSPHDGEYNLLSLTNVVADEGSAQLISGGFIYASGGTTGEPKFCYYSSSEFDHSAKVLAEGFKRNGLKPEMRAANLFAAGNLWSSFNAIQKSLEYLGVVQLPFGALGDRSLFKLVAKKYPIDAVFGLPSILADISKESGGIKIPILFYAGEPLLDYQRKILEANWGVEKFASAGYASVDAGPIGYQDPEAEAGVHILFDELISLEIKDGQGYVSSHIKESVQDYPTGDLIEILPSKNDGKTRFMLKGRADQKINIWSSRFEVSEISKILVDLDYNGNFQLVLKQEESGEVLELLVDTVLSKEKFVISLSQLRDIKQTREYDYLLRQVRVGTGNFLRNSRTGKVPKVVDLR